MDGTEFQVERNGRVTSIETPTASYVVVYGHHGTPDRSDSIPVHTKAVFLENSINWTQAVDGYAHFDSDVQYGALVKALKERGTPLYFGDPDVNRAVALPLDLGVLIGGTVLGVVLLSQLKKEKSGEVDMHRRGFLKKVGRTMVGVAGAYLSAPLLSKIGRVISHETNVGHGASAEISKKVSQVHPESMVILESFRNAVIAFKEQWIAETENGKPLIATVIGADHVSIEDVLQSSQTDKLEYLRKFKPVLHSIVKTPETFFTVRVCYPNGSAETLVIKELKELWDS